MLSVVLAGALLLCLPVSSAAARDFSAVPSTPMASRPAASKVPACILKGKQLKGRVYIESSQYSATFKVYQGSSKYSTDLSVFRAGSRYDATSCGRWFFTSSKYDADFSIYFVSSKYSADFSIYFTSSRYTAGVN